MDGLLTWVSHWLASYGQMLRARLLVYGITRPSALRLFALHQRQILRTLSVPRGPPQLHHLSSEEIWS